MVQDAYLRWHARRPHRSRGAAALSRHGGDAALPRPDEIGASAARALCRPMAAGAGGRRGVRRRCRRRSGARHFGGAMLRARTAVAARARELPVARRVRARLRRSGARARPRRSRLPAACDARPRAYRGGPAALCRLARGRPSPGRRLSARPLHRATCGRWPEILAEDAVLYSDGGGKRVAALNPIHGAEKIMRFIAGVARKNPAFANIRARPAVVNGLAGLVMREDGWLDRYHGDRAPRWAHRRHLCDAQPR